VRSRCSAHSASRVWRVSIGSQVAMLISVSLNSECSLRLAEPTVSQSGHRRLRPWRARKAPRCCWDVAVDGHGEQTTYPAVGLEQTAELAAGGRAEEYLSRRSGRA
jgi:hypothetical protein